MMTGKGCDYTNKNILRHYKYTIGRYLTYPVAKNNVKFIIIYASITTEATG